LVDLKLVALAIALALIACEDEKVAPRVDVPVVPVPVVRHDAAPAIAVPPAMTAMLDARPLMKATLAKHPRVAPWVAERMSGTTGPGAVEWNAGAPLSGQTGEFITLPGGRFELRIADELTGLDQLGVVVYELLNMEGNAEFDRIVKRAVAREIDKNQFSEAMTRREHAALVKFKVVSRELGLFPTVDDLMLLRLLETPDDFDAFEDKVQQYLREQGGGHDPRRYWEDAYDQFLEGAVR
jgi:hypothetical protein